MVGNSGWPTRCGWLLLSWCTLGCAQSVVESAFSSDFHCHEQNVTVEQMDDGRWKASGCGRSATYQCVAVQGGAAVPGAVAMPGQTLCAVQHFDEASEPSTLTTLADVQAPTKRRQVDPNLKVEKKSGQAILKLELRLDDSALLRITAAPDKQNDLVQLKLVRRELDEQADGCSLDLMVNGQVLKLPASVSTREGKMLTQRVQVGRDVIVELAAAEKMSLRSCQARYSLGRPDVERVRDFMDRYQEERAWKQEPREGGAGGMAAPSGGWPSWSVGGAAPASAGGAELDARALFKKLAPSVFRLEAKRSDGTAQGSAVAITSSELVTNCHVVQGALKLVLKQSERELPVSLVRADPKTDRCVLKSEGATLVPVAGMRGYDALEVGEKVYTLGSPIGLELTLSDGIISGRREVEGFKLVQTTAPISPGSSGGGLFDARGNLIGVTTLVLAGQQRLNQALNFAIPADAFWQ